MLYESSSQPIIFLYLLIFGFFSGFLIDLKNIFSLIFKGNKIFSQILLFFAVFFILFIFFIINLKINYGQIRFYTIFIFSLSFSIQRFLMNNFLAKPLIKCYNVFKGKRDGRKRKILEKT